MRVPALSSLALLWLVLAFATACSYAQAGAAPTASQYDAQRQSNASSTGAQTSSTGTQTSSTGAQIGPMPPAPPADAATHAMDAVRLSDVQGSAQLLDSTGKIVQHARVNMTVLPGMRLQTGNDGRAELQFPDGAVARLTPNSALRLTAVHRDAESGRVLVSLEPTRGLSYYEVPAQSPAGYAIQVGKLFATADPASAVSAAASAAVSASDQPTLLRVNLDATPFEAAVLSGAVHLADADGDVSYDLSANQSTTIDPASASNYDLAQSVTPDTWDAWNTDRDTALAEIAGSQSAGGQQPSGPGWNDLDYYGSWYDVPGEGMAWAPDGVDQSFDPYGSGAWSYSTNVGYTWASAYPWGWLPYHCGLWSYHQNYGWMWLPSSCGWGYSGGGAWFPYSETSGLGGYRMPLRPIPARGFVHTPPAYPVLPVRRGAPVHFRQIGFPRPVTRPALVAGQTVFPLPTESRPRYGPASGSLGYVGGGMRTSQGNLGARGAFQPGQPGQPLQPGQPGQTIQPGQLIEPMQLGQPGQPGYGTGMRIITPLPPPHYGASPAPRYTAPAPPMAPPPRFSPPPAPTVQAPHSAAPAPTAPAGHH